VVNFIVVRLQVKVAELVRHEEVPIRVNKCAVLVTFELTRNALALFHGHDLLAILAVEYGVVRDLEGALRRAVTQQFLFNSRSVEIT
jgi:hypothetical protein